ncbi:MAG: hypothetical protein V4671_28330 [Armatimonadota bacterium]
MNRTKSRKTGLRVIGAYTWLIGILNTVGGASTDSRFYAVDDIVVRALGVALLVLGLCLVLKKRWPLLPLIGIYGLSIIEVFVTSSPASLSTNLFAAVFLFGLPLLFLLRGLPQSAE